MYDQNTVTDTNKPKKSFSINNYVSSLTLRDYLLGWAYLRLTVSILWSIMIFISTLTTIIHSIHHNNDDNSEKNPTDPQYLSLMVMPVSCVIQLMEIAMLVTFIVAGHKRSVKLYRVYFWYCIITLPVYILIAATVVLPIENLFLDLYITFLFPDIIVIKYDLIMFFVVVIVDVCLEIGLILLVKKQIGNIINETKSRSENFERNDEECTVNVE